MWRRTWPRSRSWRGGSDERFTTSDGLSLAYRDEGAGLPLLCLPGLTRNGVDFDGRGGAGGGAARLIRLTCAGGARRTAIRTT